MNLKYRVLLSNTFLFALGNIGSKFIMFFLLPLYTNTLSSEQYGITELVVTGSNLLLPFISLSIHEAVLRFGLEKDNDEGQVLKNACVVMLGGSLLLLALIPVIRAYDAISQWTFYFVLITILHMYRRVFSLYMKSVGRIKIFVIDNIFYTLLLAVTNILFLLVLGWGISGYFLAIIISTLASIIFYFFAGGIIKDFFQSTINGVLLKNMLVFSAPMIINAVSWWVSNSSDRILLEYYLCASAVGLYSVAAKMPSLVTSLTMIFGQAWTISSVTEYDTTRDASFYEKTFRAYHFLLVLFTSLLLLVIKPFMGIYVGAEFVQTWVYVPFLLLGAVFFAYASFFGAIYTAAKKNINVMITTLIGASMNITLNVILIPRMGIYGAVFSTMATFFLVSIYRIFDSRKYLKFYINMRVVFFSLFILGIQTITVTLNFFILVFSVLCISLLLWINYKEAESFVMMLCSNFTALLTRVKGGFLK